MLGENPSGGDFQVVDGNEATNANGRVPQRAGPELLGKLIDRHAAALELYAAGWCDCPEDVLQEVLIELAARESVPEQNDGRNADENRSGPRLAAVHLCRPVAAAAVLQVAEAAPATGNTIIQKHFTVPIHFKGP